MNCNESCCSCATKGPAGRSAVLGISAAAVTVGLVGMLIGLGTQPPSAGPVVAPAALTDAGTLAPYAIDAVHSNVAFSVKHNNVSNFYGLFTEPSGSFDLDPATGQIGAVTVTLRADKIISGNGKRDDHLRSGDFFSAKEFPEITFSGTGGSIADGKGTITGELTLLGKTRPVTASYTFTGAGEARGKKVAGIDATFTIKRTDFGMDYGVAAKALGDEVTIMVGMQGASN